jgi:flagellar motor protein MotB
VRRTAWTRWLTLFTLTGLGGCAESPMVLKGQVDRLQQSQLAMSRQSEELQTRANALDRDNQELEKLVAKAQQRGKILEDQVGVLQDQLSGVNNQLTRIQGEKEEAEKEVQTLTASMRRQGGVSISPNNSFLATLPAIQLTDVHVRRDGDVIRIELPSDTLFEPGTAQLRPGAVQLITGAAGEVLQTYPDQMIGIEGHTDSDPIRSWQFRSSHQLSATQATVVQDVLVSQTRMRPEQLFIAGHGPNHPIVSNASTAGKQRNRRIELVIYPEKAI